MSTTGIQETMNTSEKTIEDTQRHLLELLNSQKPKAAPNAQSRLLNTTITDEDVKFIKAANEVIKIHQYRVDPTIRDILNRLQYSNSPHGGMPISREYLESIGTLNEQQQQSIQSSFTEHQPHIMAQPQSHSQPPLTQSLSQPSNISISNSNPTLLPPFTQNPLRNQSVNHNDFPQFSLDIFKTEEIFNDPLQQDVSGAQTYSDLITRIKHMDPGQQQILINEASQLLSLGDGSLKNKLTINSLINGTDSYELDDELSGPASKVPRLSNMLTPLSRMVSVNSPEGPITPGSDDNEHSSSFGNVNNDDTNNKSDKSRNHLCNTCGMPFKRSSDLKRHEKIHLEVPPNICPLCQKGFARKDALKRHIDTLTCKRNREKLLKAQLEQS